MTKALRINFDVLAASVVLALALTFSFWVLSYAHAQTATSTGEGPTHGITFPVPELGNCVDKDACRAYCNDIAHMDACVAFAQAHGLMNKDEASNAKKFKEKLLSGGGPGGCTNPRDCEAYCSDSTHIEACLNFAKSQGIRDKNVDDGEKILAHLKKGGHMPGDCTTKESCEAYCSNFSHYQECFDWSKATGVLHAAGGPQGSGGVITNSGGPTSDQLQKLSDLAKSGETPGSCKSKDDCESYCKDQAHRDECVAFGVKVGFIKQEEADMIKKSGGVGPGGCNSEDSCRAYCNDQTHQDECFKFAGDRGYAKPEEIKQAKDGFARLRAGLEQAPPEVAECLKSTVGTNVLDDIQSGKLTPGMEIGQSVKDCFEKFGQKSGSTEVFKNAPPEVVACLKAKFGDSFAKLQSGATAPTPEMADTFRVCFQSVQLQNGFQGERQNASGSLGQGGPAVPAGVTAERIRQFIKTVPPEVAPCIKDQLGDSFDKLQAGEDVAVDTTKIKSCFDKFRTVAPQSGTENLPQSGVQSDLQKGIQNGIGNFTREGQPPMPSGIDMACLKQILGDAGIQSLKQGMPPSPDVMSAIMKCRISGSGQDTNQFNQNPGQGLPSQGDQAPLFNQKPYYQAVPSFNAPTSGTYQPPSNPMQLPPAFPKICEYPASPSGYHYEGGDSATHCGAQLVKDQTPPTTN